MATKKSASKKSAGTEAAAEKTAATKVSAKKVAAKKTTDLQASAPEPTTAKAAAKTPEKTAGKPHPSHHDISLRAYLLWEQDGKKHGHHDHYWKQAERELKG